MPEKIRLQKYLAECSVASRRKSEELIERGEVKVNGRAAKIGDSVNPAKDVVTVNGKKIKRENSLRYIMLNKPRGYVTTMEDELGRKSVPDLLKGIKERVYPVGRLDKGSEGLLLFTNDGEFANAMMHPSHRVSKRYRVTVRPSVTEDQIAQMEAGVDIDGERSAPAEINVIDQAEGRVVLEFILNEGKNRQIRKMCESVNLEIARLKRVAVGEVKLGMLPQGKWRDLSEQEVKKLKNAAGIKTR